MKITFSESFFPESDLVLRNMFICLVMEDSLPSEELRPVAVTAESMEPPGTACLVPAGLDELPKEEEAWPAAVQKIY